MSDLPLHIIHAVTARPLVPPSIQILGHTAELDDELSTEVLWFDLPALLPPKSKESIRLVPHNNSGV
ncbi:hypothetical protein A1D31_34150 [Bradyrhizobium liaoningense]|nr:hypothetical protein A1D31_34150 [Bradyrhizobium liaoningense]